MRAVTGIGAVFGIIIAMILFLSVAFLVGGFVLMLVVGGLHANFDQVKETWSYSQGVMASIALTVFGGYFKNAPNFNRK